MSTNPEAREQIQTCSKKVRGRAQRSLDLIEAMYKAAQAAQPITGRGIGYKLFTLGLIPSWTGPRCSGSTGCLKRLGSKATFRGLGSSMKPAALNGYRRGTILMNTPAASQG